MLQELGKQNPHLMRLIQEHQADFLRLINEPVEGGEGYVHPSTFNDFDTKVMFSTNSCSPISISATTYWASLQQQCHRLYL